ncbi:uncharacterized protein BX663DRAFT_520466 [Cokeromyces recurvatus]|uniref:uncharacterized protein n=1 Tax=Cokeromyces recurvatus TaxID=90255 RepID=UPI00221FA552|nr:uncharacterized protein BX663DRAFT_520466 [Cokeromyces recurvatus]KAI7899564.1 hypothetical protein BX663DRAFT_520466 [Cokeromyces recurvatus]
MVTDIIYRTQPMHTYYVGYRVVKLATVPFISISILANIMLFNVCSYILDYIINITLSFFLNILPYCKPKNSQQVSDWSHHWPIICIIFQEMDCLMLNKFTPASNEPGQELLNWLTIFPFVP